MINFLIYPASLILGYWGSQLISIPITYLIILIAGNASKRPILRSISSVISGASSILVAKLFLLIFGLPIILWVPVIFSVLSIYQIAKRAPMAPIPSLEIEFGISEIVGQWIMFWILISYWIF